MKGTMQWFLTWLVFSLLLVLFWPVGLVGTGKTLILALVWFVSTVVFFLVVFLERVELPTVKEVFDTVKGKM